jgi:hypothetical protein
MKKTLVLVGLGAGFMYLLDPDHGERRRAQLREQLTGLLPKTSDAIHAKADALASKADDLTAHVDNLAAETITTVGPRTEDSSSGA